MKQQSTLKLNILKRMIGKRVIVITDHVKSTNWFGLVENVIDEMHLMISGPNGSQKVNIFDIRSP
jgi:ferredoxin-fold anticodon binding domain-containing protein